MGATTSDFPTRGKIGVFSATVFYAAKVMYGAFKPKRQDFSVFMPPPPLTPPHRTGFKMSIIYITYNTLPRKKATTKKKQKTCESFTESKSLMLYF